MLQIPTDEISGNPNHEAPSLMPAPMNRAAHEWFVYVSRPRTWQAKGAKAWAEHEYLSNFAADVHNA